MASNIGATEHHQFYGTGSGAAAVAVDLSGNANCTAGADYIYQSSFGYGVDCTVMVAITIEDGVEVAGYIFARYGGGQTLQGVRYDGSGALQLAVNNAIVHRLDLSDDGEIVVSWSMVVDPLNASMVRSEVRIWNATTGAFDDGISWSHTEPAGLATADIIWGALATNGVASTGGTLRGAGFLLHGSGSVQVQRDRLTPAAAPTLTGETAMEHPMPSWSCNFGSQGRPAGPTHYVAAQAVAANSLMLVSPLVNVQWESPQSIPWTTMQSNAWWAEAPDGDSYMGLPWTWRRPVPQVVDHVRCRIFIETAVEGGASSTVTVTVWSCNRNPGQDSATPLTAYSVTESVTSAAADNPGVWLDFDDLRIARTQNGERTWLTVSIEATGAGASNLSVAIHAVTIDPLSIISTDAIGEVGNG